MKNEEIVRALRRLKVETGSLVCMGCGREHNCGILGCRIVREAAELIEKLTDRCARYAEEIAVTQERTRWVPVTERLPEVGRKVLISWTANGEICFDTAFRLIDGWSATHWELSADVTHWMPLPEPPEEVE